MSEGERRPSAYAPGRSGSVVPPGGPYAGRPFNPRNPEFRELLAAETAREPLDAWARAARAHLKLRQAREDKARYRREKRYDGLFEVYELPLCLYCGGRPDSFDHVPALAVVERWGVSELIEFGPDLVKVSCCRKCNRRLGLCPELCFVARARKLGFSECLAYRKMSKGYKP